MLVSFIKLESTEALGSATKEQLVYQHSQLLLQKNA